jgi:hypothetical protein
MQGCTYQKYFLKIFFLFKKIKFVNEKDEKNYRLKNIIQI